MPKHPSHHTPTQPRHLQKGPFHTFTCRFPRIFQVSDARDVQEGQTSSTTFGFFCLSQALPNGLVNTYLCPLHSAFSLTPHFHPHKHREQQRIAKRTLKACTLCTLLKSQIHHINQNVFEVRYEHRHRIASTPPSTSFHSCLPCVPPPTISHQPHKQSLTHHSPHRRLPLLRRLRRHQRFP